MKRRPRGKKKTKYEVTVGVSGYVTYTVLATGEEDAMNQAFLESTNTLLEKKDCVEHHFDEADVRLVNEGVRKRQRPEPGA